MSLHVPCLYQGGRLHLSTPLRRAEGITKMPSNCFCMHMTRPHCLRAGWLLHHLCRYPTPTVTSSSLHSQHCRNIERPLRVPSARHARAMQTALRLSNTKTYAQAHDTHADFRKTQHASPRRSFALAAASTPPAASEKEPEKNPSVTYVAVCNRILFDVQPGCDPMPYPGCILAAKHTSRGRLWCGQPRLI